MNAPAFEQRSQDQRPAEWEPTYTLDQHITAARKRLGEEEWNRRLAEWDKWPGFQEDKQ